MTDRPAQVNCSACPDPAVVRVYMDEGCAAWKGERHQDLCLQHLHSVQPLGNTRKVIDYTVDRHFGLDFDVGDRVVYDGPPQPDDPELVRGSSGKLVGSQPGGLYVNWGDGAQGWYEESDLVTVEQARYLGLW